MPFDIIMFRLKYRTVLSTVTIRVFVSKIMRQVKWQTGGSIRIKAQQTKMAWLQDHIRMIIFPSRFAVDWMSQMSLVTCAEKDFVQCFCAPLFSFLLSVACQQNTSTSFLVFSAVGGRRITS